jgi:hypothetical protein
MYIGDKAVTTKRKTLDSKKQQLERRRKSNNNNKRKSTPFTDDFVKSAIVYDILRNMTKNVCEDVVNKNDGISYQSLSDSTKGQLQMKLNRRAKPDGIHIGKAEADWLSNHFVAARFGNLSDARKNAMKVRINIFLYHHSLFYQFNYFRTQRKTIPTMIKTRTRARMMKARTTMMAMGMEKKICLIY